MAPRRQGEKGCEEIEKQGKEDRLSALPDDILISILSLLSTSSAVAIPVLSHRWYNLWTKITRISLRFSGSYEKLKNYITAFNQLISKLTSRKIHSLRLHLYGSAHQEQLRSSLLVPSIHEICLRHPEIIELRLNHHHWSFHLPTSLLETQSLVELSLDLSFVIDFAVDAEKVIDLPRLKRLHLCVCDSHIRLMHIVLKSCPILEYLYLKLRFKEKFHHVDIVAPNLKFLTVEGYVNDYLLSIDVPKLVKLKTCGPYGPLSYRFVKKLMCLQEAHIFLFDDGFDDNNDYLISIQDLFKVISCARSLRFNGCFHHHIDLPSFPNLLELGFSGFDLRSSSWIPSWWLSNVKKITISDMTLNDNGIKLLGDILSNAPVLEQLHVAYEEYSWDEHTETRLSKEYMFSTAVDNLRRNSPNCGIYLSGGIRELLLDAGAD